MQPIEIITRSYNQKTDDPYIYSTWTRYAYYSAKDPIKTSKPVWFKNKSDQIKEILPKSDIKVACFRDDPAFILGYIVVLDRKLKWLCVKKDYHDQGIEKLLTESMKEKIDDHANEE